MRLISGTIIVIFASAAVSGATAGLADYNDISQYYGFGEMEIIKLERDVSSLRIADFNRDGRNDIAIVNNRKAKIELLIQKESVGPGETTITVDPQDVDVNQIVAPTRFDRQSEAVSQRVYGFVCGDLNSDGMTDLAFYGEPKGLYVILQKAGQSEADKSARGTVDKPKILSWRTRKKIKIDDGLVTANALVCADLNNDGADDLALAGQDGVYIILQKEDGSLAEPVKYAADALILGVEAGDLNGDEINDLILITNDSEKPVRVRLGLKTGQLGPELQFFIEKPFAVEIANSDETSGDEMLTIDSRSGRLICYKFAAERQQEADWPILFYPLTSGKENTKRDLAAGDFDGDGLEDIVISDPGAAELIFYKQKAGTGPVEAVRFPAFDDITSLSAADIDGDGKAELGVLSVKEKVMGLSRFEEERLSFPQPVGLDGEPAAMELADIDGDGDIDCPYIFGDANDVRFLGIIYNLAASIGSKSAPKIPLDSHSEKGGGKGVTVLKLEKLTSNPEGLRVVDVDQDGLQDVLIFIRYENPILVRQTKKGVFEKVDSPAAQASLIKEASLRSVGVGNVDGRAGGELLVAQKNFARSLVFSGGQNWSIIDQYNAKSTENEISVVAAFDIDGNGLSDRPAILLLDGQKGQLQILKAGEDKTYRFEKEVNVGRWSAATHLKLLFGVFTGSGDKSILLFDGEKFALVTPPRGGKIPEQLEQQFSYETKIKDGTYGNLTTGDINSDGQVDIIMVEYKQNHIEILALDWRNRPIPAMRFKVFEQKSYRGEGGREESGVEPRELKVADVTGDGKNDLITVIHDRIIIYPQD